MALLREFTPSLLHPDHSLNELEGCRCRRATAFSGSMLPLTTRKPFCDQLGRTLQNDSCVAFKIQCTPCISSYSASHTAAPVLDLAPLAVKRNRGALLTCSDSKSPLSRTRTNHQLGWEQDRPGLHVRVQAEVGRADRQAELETGLGTDEDGRKRWSGEEDSEKATALGDSTIYPIMRGVYRDDLCTLEITGDAQAWQAIEAMAADGGLTAAEELPKERPLMTGETIIPGWAEDHSAVATKLLARTHVVNRAAKPIRTHENVSMSSGNALARAFQSVVMQHLLTFDIRIRNPGTARDMANLARPGGFRRTLVPSKRYMSKITAGRLSGTIWCRQAVATSDKPLSSDELVPQQKASSTSFKAGQKRPVEILWREFFSDPTQWWDNRSEKGTSSFPDFVHKKTNEPLWVDGNSNPASVAAELAAMEPGTVPLSIFSWNKRLARYAKAKQYQKALELFQQMQLHDLKPDRFTFVPVINACAGLRALEEGRQAHSQVVLKDIESDLFIGSALVRMYAKCGSIEDAWNVFNKMPKRDVVTWTAIISGYVKCNQGKKALELAKQMQQEGVKPNPFTFVAMLSACASVTALEEGKNVHNLVIQSGCASDLYVCNSLVDMYCKCGSIKDAWMVFNKLSTRNVVSWGAMIQGYVKCGQGAKALDLYLQMQREGMEPDSGMFVAVLNACSGVGALQEGRRVHDLITKNGSESNLYVGNSLVDMYAKCGSINEAWAVFNKMPARDAVTWGAMILGYVKCGQGQKALELYQQMKHEGVQPNSVVFLAGVNACAAISALEEGKRIHEEIVQSGKEFDIFVGSSLVDMYAKCGSIEDARRLFNRMPSRNAVTWNALILGYVKGHHPETALELYQQMKLQGLQPTQVTFVALLNACAGLGALEGGRRFHEDIIRFGWDSDVFIANSLVDMYSKCGSIEDAWRVFAEMPERNVISWSSIILAHVKHGQGEKALELFYQMKQGRGIQPDSATFVAALTACASLGALEEGRRVHDLIDQSGFEIDAFVGSALVDMYVKCGTVEEAWGAFSKMPNPDVAAWGAMILGYAKRGQGEMAVQLMHRMQEEGVEPNKFTFVAWLNACASAGALEEGRRVHESMIQSDTKADIFICSSLIDMYAKCGSISDARKVFNEMGRHDVVAWGAMIMGYVKCGMGRRALALWQQMKEEGIKPDSFIFVGLLNACASIMALEEGRQIHEEVIKSGCEDDVIVGNSLVDMYAKCGNMMDAWRVFRSLNAHDVIAWSSLILGYVKFGQGKRALGLFRQMQRERVEPNQFTFVAVLKACSSLQALDEGRDIHAQIIRRGFESDIFVGSGLLDMYSKCGCMEDAWRVFSKMPKRNQVTWNAIILGYLKCGQGERALELSQLMLEEGLEPSPTTFVGMLNACANVEGFHDGKRVHELIIESGCESNPFVASSVVNMYARCGSLEDALEVFETIAKPDVFAWDAMILGYLKCGQQHRAMELLQKMQKAGIEPDPNIFGGVLIEGINPAAITEGTPAREQE